jgi:hypothetical protein
MKRLVARLERLEAKARPAEPQFGDYYDVSKLSVDELKFLLEIADICTERGESAITAEQWKQAAEMMNRARRDPLTRKEPNPMDARMGGAHVWTCE